MFTATRITSGLQASHCITRYQSRSIGAATCMAFTSKGATATRKTFRHRFHIYQPPVQERSTEIRCCLADTKKLSPKKLESILTEQGKINTNEDETTRASVFAIFDQDKKLQYIGFSKGLQESLRTIFTRRPDRAFYYKSANLTKLDQKEMVAIRDGWFDEVGGPPPGNKLALERAAWQQPADLSNSDASSKMKAAEEFAEELLQKIKARGCTEDFVADPDKLAEGQVDMTFVENLSAEAIAERDAKIEAMNSATRTATTLFEGKESEFSVYFKHDFLANGGTAYDVVVSHNEEDTSHRILVGEDFYEADEIEPEDVVMQAFAFIIQEEFERQTEGLLDSDQFPINYFSISDLDLLFPQYRAHFKRWTGVDLTGDKYWKFARVESYGAALGFLEGYEAALPEDEEAAMPEDEEAAMPFEGFEAEMPLDEEAPVTTD